MPTLAITETTALLPHHAGKRNDSASAADMNDFKQGGGGGGRGSGRGGRGGRGGGRCSSLSQPNPFTAPPCHSPSRTLSQPLSLTASSFHSLPLSQPLPLTTPPSCSPTHSQFAMSLYPLPRDWFNTVLLGEYTGPTDEASLNFNQLRSPSDCNLCFL